MKRFIWIGIIFVILIVGFFAFQIYKNYEAKNIELVTYTNQTYNFKINHPANWVVSEHRVNANIPFELRLTEPGKKRQVFVDAVQVTDDNQLLLRVRKEVKDGTPVLPSPDYRTEKIEIGGIDHTVYFGYTECGMGTGVSSDCSQFRIYVEGPPGILYILYGYGEAELMSDLYLDVISSFSLL